MEGALYLVSDFDEQDEDDNDEQVVKDADSSDDDVDDFECEVTDVGKIQRQIVFFWRGCCDVVPDSTRQRFVLHRWSTFNITVVVTSTASATDCLRCIKPNDYTD